jgi:hypothetical protein
VSNKKNSFHGLAITPPPTPVHYKGQRRDLENVKKKYQARTIGFFGSFFPVWRTEQMI